MPSEEPEKGDKVTWNWGSGQPGGTVAETKTEGDLAITSKRGNKIKKNASPSNPAVHIERSGNDVVKKASELNVEEKANGSGGGGEQKEEQQTESKAGDKRKHEKTEDASKGEGENEPLEENAEGKTIMAKDNKKQKKEPAKKEAKKDDKKEAAKEDKKAEKKEPEKKDDEPKQEKGKRGRPKKAEGGAAKAKKEPTPRSADGIGSRTRSRAK